MCCPTKAPAHAHSPHSCSARGINPPQVYHDSLEQFIDRCNLHDLIASARSDVAEAPIRQRIEAMDLDQIREHHGI